MLVLTRKAQEEIMIGENIKITLVRVRGNSVRIGIEAPAEVRIVRGELEMRPPQPAQTADRQAADVEVAADHSNAPQRSANHVARIDAWRDRGENSDRAIFVGRIHRPESSDVADRGPLARFVAPR